MEKASVARAIAEHVLDPILQRNVQTMVITLRPTTPTGSTEEPGTMPAHEQNLDSVVRKAVVEYPRRFHDPAEGVQLRANLPRHGRGYDHTSSATYSFEVSKTFPSAGHLSMRRAFSVFGIDFVREINRALKTKSGDAPNGFLVEVDGYTFFSDKDHSTDSISIRFARTAGKSIQHIILRGRGDASYRVSFPANANYLHPAQVEAFVGLRGTGALRSRTYRDRMTANPSDPDTQLGKEYNKRVTKNIDNTPIWALLSVLLKEMDRRYRGPWLEISPNPARPWHLRGPFVDMAV
jgi:hypothetical protein